MFNNTLFDALCAALSEAAPSFDQTAFMAAIYDDGWKARELKDRMRHTTLTLREHLPADYRAALAVLYPVQPRMAGIPFAGMIFPDFVEVFGLDDWEASLPALEAFTKNASSEFAVRPFILQDPERMMAQMLTWANSDDVDVRRLASEGCRPRLPWAIALPPFKADPTPILPILEALKRDPAEYVRRSVANNLNDIAKDHPQTVLDVTARWLAEDNSKETQWLVNHALRTRIKQGDLQALNILGYPTSPAVRVHNLTLTPEIVPLEGTLTFSFSITSEADIPQNLMIDSIVHLMRKNGSTTPKVFKLTKRTIQPQETLHLTRKRSFKPVTTRVYYPGAHALEIQINGEVLARADFVLGTS